jgi:hypothetical protein
MIQASFIMRMHILRITSIVRAGNFKQRVESDEKQIQYLPPHEERMNFGLTGTFGSPNRENSANPEPNDVERTRLAR